TPHPRATPGECDVHGLGGLARFDLAPREVLGEPGDRLLDLLLGGVRARTEAAALLRRQRADAGEQSRDEPLLPAEVTTLQPLELRARRHAAARLLAEGGQDGRDRVVRGHALARAALATPTRCVKAGGSEAARS